MVATINYSKQCCQLFLTKTVLDKLISSALALEIRVSQTPAEETAEDHLFAGRMMEAGSNTAWQALLLNIANIILHFHVLAIILIGSINILVRNAACKCCSSNTNNNN